MIQSGWKSIVIAGLLLLAQSKGSKEWKFYDRSGAPVGEAERSEDSDDVRFYNRRGEFMGEMEERDWREKRGEEREDESDEESFEGR